MLAGAGMGVGSLVFSLSSSASKSKINKNTLGDTPMLLKDKDAFLNDEEIPKEAKKPLNMAQVWEVLGQKPR